jgi:hypothetical protein
MEPAGRFDPRVWSVVFFHIPDNPVATDAHFKMAAFTASGAANAAHETLPIGKVDLHNAVVLIFLITHGALPCQIQCKMGGFAEAENLCPGSLPPSWE